jgi:hypothetical protein
MNIGFGQLIILCFITLLLFSDLSQLKITENLFSLKKKIIKKFKE